MKRWHDEIRWADVYRSCWIAGFNVSHTAIKNRINKEIGKGNVQQVGGKRGRYRLKTGKRRTA